MSFDLSIIIPTYNCAPWLERAVRSCLKVGISSLEVIVVDDGSTDDTPDLLKGLQVEIPFLKPLRKANGGLSSARNFGVEHAEGRYLLLLDADDELMDCDLAPVMATNHDMVRIGFVEVTLDGEVKLHAESAEMTTGRRYLQDHLDRNFFFTAGCAYLYRTDWLVSSQLRFAEGIVHEDMLFTIQALLAAKSVSATPQPVYRYFRRADSITTKRNDEQSLLRLQSLRFVAGKLTGLANVNPDLGIDWWIDQTMAYAFDIALRSPNRRVRYEALLMQTDLLRNYRLWGINRDVYREIGKLNKVLWALVYNSVRSDNRY